MARVRIVLNRPESPENIGAAARAIANTGLAGLDLVTPGDWRTVETWRMAWRAEEVLEEAREFETLEAAIGDAVYVAGFAGREGKKVSPITPRRMAAEVAELAEDAEVALVFGCESKGLTEEDLCLCQRRVRIPSHPRQPSLNLAQAVMVAGYEVYAGSEGGVLSAPALRARQEDVARALDAFKEALLAVEFLPEQNPEARFVEWREIFGRAGLTERETRVLLALARRVGNTGRIVKARKARSQ
jgi:TrmH family RNA methyltransferase